MAVDGKENGNQYRDDDQDDPGTFTELCDGKYDHHDCGTHCAKAIHEHFVTPALIIAQCRAWFNDLLSFFKMTDLPPAPCHSCLGEGKGEEHADRIERDQAGDIGPIGMIKERWQSPTA